MHSNKPSLRSAGSRHFNHSKHGGPKSTDRKETTSKSPSKDRYDLRSFIKQENGQEVSSNQRLSWAEQCEAAESKPSLPIIQDESSVSSPMKGLTVTSPDKGNSDFATGTAFICKIKEEKTVSPRPKSGRKRERNREQVLDFAHLSPSTDGVKRRLGWNRGRSFADDASTTSSSMCSSDNEQSSKRFETDPAVLQRRQKQIDYGKNTKGYRLYLQAIPKSMRTPDHIFTPKKHIEYSRRSWDSQIKIWRRRLHEWDPRSDDDEDEDVDLSEMAGMIEK